MTSHGRGRPARGSTSENMKDIMHTFRTMAYATRDQAAAANRLMERVDQWARENPRENPGGEGAD